MKPMVGLLYNPALPPILEALSPAIDFLEVIPDRLWYDFGAASSPRFQPARGAIDTLAGHGLPMVGHGIGLSLASAMPIDEGLVDAVAALNHRLRFGWYSEHLSQFLVPGGAVPNAQAGMGLPVVHDAETLDILTDKLALLKARLGCPLLLENGTIFSAIPDDDMTEPAFFNALYSGGHCGVLLDLHNLYANTRNLGWDADAYIAELIPESVTEIHLAGGDELLGHYTDSHSRPTPDPVWDLAHRWAPRFPNLRALTYEFHESYFPRLGVGGIAHELARMHALADQCALVTA
ncbi:MAG: DUF692 family protein [Sandarakinorhabdus sp.]|nr:DUF692 family protein [Sandarakinorhabdus sp.]